MKQRKANLAPTKARAAELLAMDWGSALSALEGERFKSRRDAIIGHMPPEVAERAQGELLARDKFRQKLARRTAIYAAKELRRAMREKHPELIENADLASRSGFYLAELDRWFLTGEARVEARQLRKSFLAISDAAALLGVSDSRLDKLDKEGGLPHCGTRSFRFAGKQVQGRVWSPASITEYKERTAA